MGFAPTNDVVTLQAQRDHLQQLVVALEQTLAEQKLLLQAQETRVTDALAMLDTLLGVIRRAGGWLPGDDQAILRAAERLLHHAGWKEGTP